MSDETRLRSGESLKRRVYLSIFGKIVQSEFPPDAILKEGRLDGCRQFRLYWQLVLPVVSPALGAWAIIVFIARWNDFMWPLLFLRSKETYTLVLSISVLPANEGLSTPWPVIMAGTTIAVLPLLCIYLLLQRFQVSGLSLGAVKG